MAAKSEALPIHTKAHILRRLGTTRQSSSGMFKLANASIHSRAILAESVTRPFRPTTDSSLPVRRARQLAYETWRPKSASTFCKVTDSTLDSPIRLKAIRSCPVAAATRALGSGIRPQDNASRSSSPAIQLVSFLSSTLPPDTRLPLEVTTTLSVYGTT